MFEEEVKSGAGVTKRVVASSQEELDEAIKATKAENAPVAVDINQPVAKGHDLLDVDETSQTVGLVDGTGAHNSPNDAVVEAPAKESAKKVKK